MGIHYTGQRERIKNITKGERLQRKTFKLGTCPMPGDTVTQTRQSSLGNLRRGKTETEGISELLETFGLAF